MIDIAVLGKPSAAMKVVTVDGYSMAFFADEFETQEQLDALIAARLKEAGRPHQPPQE